MFHLCHGKDFWRLSCKLSVKCYSFKNHISASGLLSERPSDPKVTYTIVIHICVTAVPLSQSELGWSYPTNLFLSLPSSVAPLSWIISHFYKIQDMTTNPAVISHVNQYWRSTACQMFHISPILGSSQAVLVCLIFQLLFPLLKSYWLQFQIYSVPMNDPLWTVIHS